MKVCHVTDMSSAESIILKKLFTPYDCNNKHNPDNGLNLLSATKNNSYKRFGVKIVFEWHGKYKEVSEKFRYEEMENDVLYKQEAWRHFIKPPITQGNLQIIEVIILDEQYYINDLYGKSQTTLDDHIESIIVAKHKMLYFLPKCLFKSKWNKYHKEEKEAFLKNLKSCYQESPLTILIQPCNLNRIEK